MKARLIKLWKQVYTWILVKPLPHTLVSWRFLVPNQPWQVKLHRRVWLKAWSRLPRWVWGLIFIYSSSSWLLWYGWKHIYYGLKRNGQFVFEHYNIKPLEQFNGLISAAFLHGIPAHTYYQFRLFNRPQKQWFDFVYTHELPHWHTTMSPDISAETQRLLSDKAYFAEAFSQKGLATIPTLRKLERGQFVDEEDLFLGSSCFLKPNIGSRSEGCMQLSYQPESCTYQLTGDAINGVIEQRTSILDFVCGQLKQRDYIIQPLLKNHASIQQYSPTEILITLRLITACNKKDEIQVVSALLEIPSPEDEQGWWLMAIDCETGCFIDTSENWFKAGPSFLEAIKNIAGQTMPFWPEITSLCSDAHQHCQDLISIGWDVVITTDGVHLLEGNINWAVAQHQLAYKTAMLNTALGKNYRSYLQNH